MLTVIGLISARGQDSSSQSTLIIVVGAAGEAEFGSNFVRQATLWQKARPDTWREVTIGLGEPNATNDDFTQLKQTLESEHREGSGGLWLIMIGHGTFDGKEARFNLRGPDVSASDLVEWLRPFHRSIAVVDTSSSSAPFLNKLSATNRVIITATRSGHEQNFARFGQYFAETLSDPDADLDKDGSVSLLESFLIASRKTSEFYKVENRLATEHALLDDNGDGMGTPADWFRGLRAIKKPKENAAVDGLLAQQFHLRNSESEQNLKPEDLAQRDALERAVLLYREKKSQVPEETYYRELEKLLLDLARFYQKHSKNTSTSLLTK